MSGELFSHLDGGAGALSETVNKQNGKGQKRRSKQRKAPKIYELSHYLVLLLPRIIIIFMMRLAQLQGCWTVGRILEEKEFREFNEAASFPAPLPALGPALGLVRRERKMLGRKMSRR